MSIKIFDQDNFKPWCLQYWVIGLQYWVIGQFEHNQACNFFLVLGLAAQVYCISTKVTV